jgi:hypothetical protein
VAADGGVERWWCLRSRLAMLWGCSRLAVRWLPISIVCYVARALEAGRQDSNTEPTNSCCYNNSVVSVSGACGYIISTSKLATTGR